MTNRMVGSSEERKLAKLRRNLPFAIGGGGYDREGQVSWAVPCLSSEAFRLSTYQVPLA